MGSIADLVADLEKKLADAKAASDPNLILQILQELNQSYTNSSYSDPLNFLSENAINEGKRSWLGVAQQDELKYFTISFQDRELTPFSGLFDLVKTHVTSFERIGSGLYRQDSSTYHVNKEDKVIGIQITK